MSVQRLWRQRKKTPGQAPRAARPRKQRRARRAGGKKNEGRLRALKGTRLLLTSFLFTRSKGARRSLARLSAPEAGLLAREVDRGLSATSQSPPGASHQTAPHSATIRSAMRTVSQSVSVEI